jgi:hypothetical protein
MTWSKEENDRVKAIEKALERAGFPVKAGKEKPAPEPAAPADVPASGTRTGDVEA